MCLSVLCRESLHTRVVKRRQGEGNKPSLNESTICWLSLVIWTSVGHLVLSSWRQNLREAQIIMQMLSIKSPRWFIFWKASCTVFWCKSFSFTVSLLPVTWGRVTHRGTSIDPQAVVNTGADGCSHQRDCSPPWATRPQPEANVLRMPDYSLEQTQSIRSQMQ